MKHFILILILIVVTTKVLFPQNDEIARTGSSVITLEEFRNRYEFMPHLNYSDDDPEILRKEFLYSLIAEKLWAMEAVELSYDTLEAVRYSMENLRKLLIKDELYKEEVESKIQIIDEEIAKGLLIVNRILKVNIISSRDSSEIFSISEAIKDSAIKTSSAKFDSVLSLRKEYEIQEAPLEITFGKLQEEEIEEMLFSMMPGTISEPLKTGDGWFIFRLREEDIDPAIKPSTEHARNIVFNILKERKAQKIGRDFLGQVIGGRSVSADGKVLENVLFNLIAILNENHKDQSLENGFELTSKISHQLMQRVDEKILSEEFIQFQKNPLSARDFLYYLFYQKLVFNSLQPQIVRAVLNKAVRQFIEDEMIVMEGLKRGLDKRENIQSDLRTWKDYYLYQLLMQSYSDSVRISEGELKGYYLEKTNLPDLSMHVNIVEILTDDLNTVEEIFNELEQGKDFKELAVQYTQREWSKKSGGEFGYFSVKSGGEIGRIAASMDVGEIYGPLKVPEGYSVFQVIGKRELPDSLQKSFEEKKDLLRTQLGLQRLTKQIVNNTIKLANKFDVNINEQLLKKAELLELNTFTYRLIGFGGKIAAFTIALPMFEWYELWKEGKVLP